MASSRPASSGFFSRLNESLATGAVALATVVQAEGSTPRIAGARQFITVTGESFGSVGGGVAESRVLALARESLADGRPRIFRADLRGKPGDIRDGVCGGTMTIWIARLDASNAGNVVGSIDERLRAGKRVAVATLRDGPVPLALVANETPAGLTDAFFEEMIEPLPRLLVVGAGHIGRALARLSCDLDFEVVVQDGRPEWLVASAFPAQCTLEGSLSRSIEAMRQWEGVRAVALVTRGMPEDGEALAALGSLPEIAYLGILGSRKRVATVLATHHGTGALPWPDHVIHAPIGLEIGAETPAEIAVSIAAEIIRVLRQGREAARRMSS